MKLHLSHPSSICEGELQITGSKSETNRLLLLQALYPEIVIKNGSESDDSVAMRKALTSDSNLIDVHHAGTAMRFLTAYFAFQKGRNVVLTGSKRMQERPIKILVEALRSLGAKIEYQNLDMAAWPGPSSRRANEAGGEERLVVRPLLLGGQGS